MKIINKTNWRTDHLRAFVARIAQDELDPAKRKLLRVFFKPGRAQNGTSGQWWGGTSHTVEIFMPTGAAMQVPALVPMLRIDFAATIAHELAHVQTRMRGRSVEIQWRRSVRYGRPKTASELAEQERLYAWAVAMPLERQAAKAKPPQPTRQQKLAKQVQQAHARTAKLLHAQALLAARVKRWQAKCKALDRRLAKASMAASPPPPSE